MNEQIQAKKIVSVISRPRETWNFCTYVSDIFNFPLLQAREAVEMRAQLEKKLAQKEKEKRELKLVQLAQKARDERAGIKTADGKWITAGWVRIGLKMKCSREALSCC